MHVTHDVCVTELPYMHASHHTCYDITDVMLTLVLNRLNELNPILVAGFRSSLPLKHRGFLPASGER